MGHSAPKTGLLATSMPFNANSLEFLEFPSTDPAYNLALEETLFLNLPENHPGYFILWQNQPSVIVGRHQCVADSVNLTLARQQNLPVIRRLSGGGTVYHDEGNLNFSFIVPGSQRTGFAHFLEPICLALGSCGIKASLSGRNDLETQGKKFSGSSQYMAKNKILHHGTLLVNTDLSALAAILRIRDDKLAAKAIKSVKSRVVNLSEAAPEKIAIPFLKKLLPRFCSGFDGEIPSAIHASAQKLAEKKYRDPDWTFEKSSPYTLEKHKRFSWGEITLRLLISDGIIKRCSISGDFFNYLPIGKLEEKIRMAAFTPVSMETNLRETNWADYFAGCDEKSMARFFTHDIFEQSANPANPSEADA